MYLQSVLAVVLEKCFSLPSTFRADNIQEAGLGWGVNRKKIMVRLEQNKTTEYFFKVETLFR